MKCIDTERVVIKSWCDNPEEGALEQTKHLANLPFVFKQVCLMPDVHQGYGMPIGGVIACRNVVIPNAVGVDIGCGMAAVKTSLTEIKIDILKEIMGDIRNKIPVGFNKHSQMQPEMFRFDDEITLDLPTALNMFSDRPVVRNEFENAAKSLGTLGGGNHFIEIQKGNDEHIWFMIHSGSRNVGKKVADHHNKKAVKLNERWYSQVPKEWQLAFMPLDTFEAKEYLREMEFCLRFAQGNRDLMAKRIKESFVSKTNCEFLDEVNIHHNYARMENHFGKNLMVHRKGATSAKEGELGIIPGSQGTSSYIVKGKGNPESFMSCSHGAGRKMSRTKAIKELSLDEEKKMLEDKGIIHSIRNQKDLDEASSAYKDISVVMEEQKDLVDIVVKLEPLAVIKG